MEQGAGGERHGQRFSRYVCAEAISETLIAFALRTPADGDMRVSATALCAETAVPADQLEQVVNTAGYTLLSNPGVAAAICVFTLSTLLSLHPQMRRIVLQKPTRPMEISFDPRR
ncbi:hypothetical protein XAXN_05575 [Xanthomonas axonopodis]|uniref:Uncharacterized protein n=1 Tax=Xanthomonas axonopodis TaxID=53413 RepID=A0A0N8GDV6_9XANT|nr:hypothetical protein [Xanthomonas axonopodis]KPL49785.1 hypothetical protein XAXN_05575 [Xanthomonas axonopodis]